MDLDWVFLRFGLSMFLVLDGVNMMILHWRSESTVGVVIAIESSNHGLHTIRYRVGSRDYVVGSGMSGKPVGSEVPVFYDPNNPARATVDDPAGGLWYDLAIPCVSGALMATVIVLQIRLRIFRPISEVRVTPRSVTATILLCAALVLVNRYSEGRLVGKGLVLALVGLAGCVLLAFPAFRVGFDGTWRTFIRSRIVPVGAMLIVVAEVIELAS